MTDVVDDDVEAAASWREAIVTLQDLSVSEDDADYDRISSIISTLLQDSGSGGGGDAEEEDAIPDDVRSSLSTMLVRSLLRLGRYDDALEVSKKSGGRYEEEGCYALYRLRRFVECRSSCEKILKRDHPRTWTALKTLNGQKTSGDDGDGDDGSSDVELEGLLHVYAQCLYRLDDAPSAMRVYAHLIRLRGEHGGESSDEVLLTNLLASTVANRDNPAGGSAASAPSTGKGRGKGKGPARKAPSGVGGDGETLDGRDGEAAMRFLYGCSSGGDGGVLARLLDGNRTLEQIWGDDEGLVNYDLAYNAATAMLLYGDSRGDVQRASSLLRQAESACKDAHHASLESYADAAEAADELKSELAPIQGNLAFSLLLLAVASSADDGNNDGGGDDETKLAEAMFAKVLVSRNDGAAAAASNNVAVIRADRADAQARRQQQVRGRRGGGGADGRGGNDPSATLLRDATKRLPDVGRKDPAGQPLLSPGQVGRVLRNRAVILLRLGRLEECREALAECRRAAAGRVDDVGLDLLESCLLDREGKPKDAAKLLEDVEKNAQAKNDTFGIAEVKLHTAQLLLDQRRDVADAIPFLEGLDPKIRQSPAVTATLAEMYNSVGKNIRAAELVASVSPNIDEGDVVTSMVRTVRAKKANADFKMQFGLYEEAASIYEELLKLADDGAVDLDDEERLCISASLVQALSFFDLERAEDLVGSLPSAIDEGVDGVLLDGEELERKELPRSQRIRKLIAVDRRHEERKKSNSTSRETRLRQRAKAKAAYLAKLESEGRYNPQKPSKPDPERWIPKKQRSYNKRGRRGRNKFVGAQGAGAGTEKDAARLDAAARAAAKHGGSSAGQSTKPSTAHMDVSSSGGNVRRGGKKRR